MDPRGALFEELQALFGGVPDPEIHHGLGILFHAVKIRPKPRGDAGAAQRREPFHLRHIGNRHDSGNDGNPDAGRAGPPDEIEIKEKD